MPRYWILVFLATLAWSAAEPHDILTWFLDMLLAGAIFLGLAASGRRFPLTPLCYGLLLALCVLILVGAHYSFSRVPAFDALKIWLGSGRNDFDKLAHFFQGLAPAVLFREILIRGDVMARRQGLGALVLALSLALSAAYELVEWLAAVTLGQRAENFLAIQGDPWDAQSDMAMALAGAMAAQILFRRVHDRQLARLAQRAGATISPIRRFPSVRSRPQRRVRS